LPPAGGYKKTPLWQPLLKKGGDSSIGIATLKNGRQNSKANKTIRYPKNNLKLQQFARTQKRPPPPQPKMVKSNLKFSCPTFVVKFLN